MSIVLNFVLGAIIIVLLFIIRGLKRNRDDFMAEYIKRMSELDIAQDKLRWVKDYLTGRVNPPKKFLMRGLLHKGTVVDFLMNNKPEESDYDDG